MPGLTELEIGASQEAWRLQNVDLVPIGLRAASWFGSGSGGSGVLVAPGVRRFRRGRDTSARWGFGIGVEQLRTPSRSPVSSRHNRPSNKIPVQEGCWLQGFLPCEKRPGHRGISELLWAYPEPRLCGGICRFDHRRAHGRFSIALEAAGDVIGYDGAADGFVLGTPRDGYRGGDRSALEPGALCEFVRGCGNGPTALQRKQARGPLKSISRLN